jgi:hypothetical protein
MLPAIEPMPGDENAIPSDDDGLDSDRISAGSSGDSQ